MQTDVDMDTGVDMEMGVKSVYIRAFRPREISQSTSLSSIQSNMRCYFEMKMIVLCRELAWLSCENT